MIRGNNLADEEVRKAALLSLKAPDTPVQPQDPRLSFTEQEKGKLKQMGLIEKENGSWELPDGRKVLPKALAWRIMRQFHQQTHWGVQALVDQFTTKYMSIGVYNIAKQLVSNCMTYQRVNKHQLREKVLRGRELAH